MRFSQMSVLVFASTSLAIPLFGLPSFTLPGLGGGKTTTTSAVATSTKKAVASSSKTVSTTPTSSVAVAPVTTSASSTKTSTTSSKTSSTSTKTSTSATSTAPASTSCTYQGAGGGDTEDGVVNGNCCTDLTVVYARGTSESGNVGSVAGPPMFSSLRSKLGDNRVTVQGVDYPADSAGNSNQGGTGGATMASNVKQALSQCPNTKVVTSGYSQGGMVVHNAFSSQGLTSTQVSAAVLFGDPQNGQAVGNLASSDVLEECASGDDVCNGSGTYTITQAHLSYGDDADAAADFIINALGL